jgi:hypothetical protein
VATGFPQTYSKGAEVLSCRGPIAAFAWADEQVAARRRPGQSLVRVTHGHPSLWTMGEACVAVPADETIELLDILHVSSYV